MTAEEAIEIITNTVQTEYMTAEQDKALAIAQEALEKQIPKKPADIVHWESTNLTIGVCHICGTGVNNYMNYCDKCGQAIDWSEKNA